MTAAYSSDGIWIASGGTDRTIRLWRADDRQERAVLHGHTAFVKEVAFETDGRRVASPGSSFGSRAKATTGTARCGSGTGPTTACPCSEGIRATSTQWLTARTANGSPREAGTTRCACGMHKRESTARHFHNEGRCGL